MSELGQPLPARKITDDGSAHHPPFVMQAEIGPDLADKRPTASAQAPSRRRSFPAGHFMRWSVVH